MLVRNGATRLTKPLTEIRIPPTVHGILASRIDALPKSEKDLLQTLAVIGKDFPLNLVRRITASPDDRLEPMLKSLRASEFIYEQPASGEAVTQVYGLPWKRRRGCRANGRGSCAGH